MLSLQVFLVAVAAVFIPVIHGAIVVCYYDGNSYHRDGVAKTNNITEAAAFCDQLIYGYYKINSDYKIETSFKFPYPAGANAGSELKLINPNLKVLLGVGGHVENRKTDRALKLVESPEKRTSFVHSVHQTIIDHNYDGTDLGWQWPESFREDDKRFLGDGLVDTLKGFYGKLKEQWRESPSHYAEGFNALVRELRAVLKPSGKMLSISALPHVNATAYYDLPNLMNVTDQFVLHTYDYRSPRYFPLLADFSAPLHYKNATFRNPSFNIETTVSDWLSAGVPSEKIIVAIPTFGRAWEVDGTIVDMTKNHVDPPFGAMRAAQSGTYTKIPGLRSYFELCPHLINFSQLESKSANGTTLPTGSTLLIRVPDSGKRLGTYCYRAPDTEKGIWISYEEPETAAVKASYIKLKKLGGAAIVDLSLDDFKGMCDGNPYPISKAIKENLK